VSNDAAVGAEFENMRSDDVDKQDRPAGMISSAINVAGIMLAGRQQSKTIAVCDLSCANINYRDE
jgi:hypothetical protein